MSDNTRKSGLRPDPNIAALLKNSVENRAALSPKQRRDRSRVKATYDLPPEIQEAINAVARAEDTSSSQAVAAFLAYALHCYQSREPDLIEGLAHKSLARTPRFSWNLDIPAPWQTTIDHLAQQHLPPGWRKR